MSEYPYLYHEQDGPNEAEVLEILERFPFTAKTFVARDRVGAGAEFVRELFCFADSVVDDIHVDAEPDEDQYAAGLREVVIRAGLDTDEQEFTAAFTVAEAVVHARINMTTIEL